MDWKARLRSAWDAEPSPVPDDDVLEELAQHASALYQKALADGLSQQEADRLVAEQIAHWKVVTPELSREPGRRTIVEPPPAASTSRLAGLGHDIRYAARLLLRQPRFTVLAGLTMALGIGATTALFTVSYGVLMRPLPWPQAERLVVFRETRGGHAPRFGSFSSTAYLAWREESRTLESLAAWSERTVTLGEAGEPERIRVTSATASLFPALGARALIGTLFGEKDEVARDGAVIVLAEGLWRQRFGADPDVLGRLVRIDGQPHVIIGVLPEDQAYPDHRTRAWVPFHVPPTTGNSLSMFAALGRLRGGVTPAQAAAEGTARGAFATDTGMTTMAIFGGEGPVEVSAEPLREAMTSDVRRPLLVLLGAAGLLLLTATSNVASLHLARATTRRHELAIRAALGAGSTRVTRQLLIESMLLGLVAGTAGLGLAWLLHGAIPSILPSDFPRADELRLDPMVALFALSMSLLTGFLSGALPALQVRRLNLSEALSEDGKAPVGAGHRSRSVRARLLIMAGQIGVTCILLVGASLLGRSFVALLQADRGYDPAGVLTTRLALPASIYTPERRHETVAEVLERLRTMPAVSEVAFTSELPLTPGGSTSAFTLQAPGAGGVTVSVQASPRIVSPRYFAALDMDVVAGRGFAESDTDGTEPVAIVNQTFARRYLGDAPLGTRLPMGVGYGREDLEATVIGVIGDVKYLTAGDATHPEVYYSYLQFEGQLMIPSVTLLVRTPTDPAALVDDLRAVVRAADADLAPEAIMTLEGRMLTNLARPRLYSVLIGGFALLALIVAGVGLYGVLSYTVVQRTREIGVRLALGAQQADIVRLVLRQGYAVTATGLAAGLLGSLAVMRAMDALLYGVTAQDGVTYMVVPLILGLVATAACVGPARRAARLDPVRALRG